MGFANPEKTLWERYRDDPAFQAYMRRCREFDPVGFDRALHRDEDAGCYAFHFAIVENFLVEGIAPGD